MFLLTIERLSDGKELELTHNGETLYDADRKILDHDYFVTQVDGIELPEIDMATYDIASMDGVKVSNIKMPDREITVTVLIRNNVERNRIAIHQLCRVRSVMRLHFVTDGGAKYIDGYIKSIDSNRFSNNVEMDLTFICPDPYFKDENSIVADMSRRYGTWFFGGVENLSAPKSTFVAGSRPVEVFDALRTAVINSVSENRTGIIIRVTFLATTTSIRITNVTTGDYFLIENYDFHNGDILEINTISGQKDVVLYRDGSEIQMLTSVADGSTFFQLESGDNLFNYVIGGDRNNVNAQMEFRFTPIYMEL